MKKYWFLILFFALTISACVSKQEKTFVLETEHPEDMMFEITNNGNYTAEFSMLVNDLDLSSNYKIVEYIKDMPEEYPGEPLELKAARFVYDFTWKDNNVTNTNVLYNPKLVINSVGGGLCGVRSAVLTNVLRLLGFKARSICLEGHVVTEVFIDEYWQVIDVDYGVYYLNKYGEIASYEELIENPEIFRDICNYKAYTGAESTLMNAFVFKNENVYSSIDDNKPYETHFTVVSKDDVFILPPNSSFSFPYRNCRRGNFYTTAKLEIPLNWIGEFSVPFVLESIDGVGEILIDGEKLKCDGSLMNFEDFNFTGSKIKILHSISRFTVNYFVNPLVCDVRDSNQLTFNGDNLSNISANLVENDNEGLYYHPIFRDCLLDMSFDMLRSFNEENNKYEFQSRESTILDLCLIVSDSTRILTYYEFDSFRGVAGSNPIAFKNYFRKEMANFSKNNCQALEN